MRMRMRSPQLGLAALAAALLLLVPFGGAEAAAPGANGLIAYSDGAGIVVANADGSSPTHVTSDPLDENPSWNGEGTKIAYDDHTTVKVISVANGSPPTGGTAA